MKIKKMKNLKFPFSLLLCLFFLLTSTASQAITTTTSAKEAKNAISTKEQVKLERLKKKLSNRIAIIKQKKNYTEREDVERKANRARKLGLAALVFGLGQVALLGTSVLLIASLTSIIFTVFGIVSSGQALKRIKKSSNPKQYKKSKKRAISAILLSVLGLAITGMLVGLYYYLIVLGGF